MKLKKVMSHHVILNVGGKLFETTSDTLIKSKYFVTRLNGDWNEKEIMFVDRNPNAFEDILNYMRDINHRVNRKYKYELDFYAITYTEDNLYDEDAKINNLLEVNKSFINMLNTIINNTYVTCGKLDKCIKELDKINGTKLTEVRVKKIKMKLCIVDNCTNEIDEYKDGVGYCRDCYRENFPSYDGGW